MEQSDTEEPPTTSQELRRMVAGNDRHSRVSFSEMEEDHLEHNDADFCENFLNLHNSFRKIHLCTALTPNEQLTTLASKRVEIVSKKPTNVIVQEESGESIFYTGNILSNTVAEFIVRQWYREKSQYDFNHPQYYEDAKHFTQMIWKETKHMGVGFLREGRKVCVVALYDPIGNIPGKFEENVHETSNMVKDIWPSVIFERQCLLAHNKHRAMHGSPPLKINKDMCDFAENWVEVMAQKKKLECSRECTYGQNAFTATSKSLIQGEQVVQIWYNEISKHNFKEHKFSPKTGHFTQVIWRNTQRLGVGYLKDGNTTWILCCYDPPGNYPGEFLENVLPLNSRPSKPSSTSQLDRRLSFQRQILEEHNKLRRFHGAPPLVLSNVLADFASERAEHLAAQNSLEPSSKNKYGENIYLAKEIPLVTADRVVQAWYNEIGQYDFKAATFSTNSACFAQVVWLDTTELGVGTVKKNGSTWVVCNYKPPGNYNGLFREKVRLLGSKLYLNPNLKIPFDQQCVIAHNKYREKHGCPPLALSKKLSEYALEWAKYLMHRNTVEYSKNNDYSENIFMAVGYFVHTGEYVTKTWYDEIKFFNFKKPELCKAAVDFTHMIWKSTKDLGVGFVEVDDVAIVVANYFPPGNVGSFAENVPPLVNSGN